MSSNDRLQGGMKHAPGVLCRIRVPYNKRRPGRESNNGKYCTLEKIVPRGSHYICGCGMGGMIKVLSGSTDPIWEVTGDRLLCDSIVTRRVFPQSWLIPLGDSSLVKGEKWEETNPKEDLVEYASVLLAIRRRQVLDRVSNF